ncbi:hypothetical protein ACX9NE_02560 [Mycobacterium sp. ML4]
MQNGAFPPPVINPTTHAVSTIPLGFDAVGVAISPIGSEAGDVYLSGGERNTVTVIG